MSVDSLNAVVVAERLRSHLHDLLNKELTTGDFSSDSLAKTAGEMLNDPGMELDPTIRELLTDVIEA